MSIVRFFSRFKRQPVQVEIVDSYLMGFISRRHGELLFAVHRIADAIGASNDLRKENLDGSREDIEALRQEVKRIHSTFDIWSQTARDRKEEINHLRNANNQMLLRWQNHADDLRSTIQAQSVQIKDLEKAMDELMRDPDDPENGGN